MQQYISALIWPELSLGSAMKEKPHFTIEMIAYLGINKHY